MLLFIKTTENGWNTERRIELPDDEKLLASILRTVKKHTAQPPETEGDDARQSTGVPEAEPSDVPADVPSSAPAGPAAKEAFVPKHSGFLLLYCDECGKGIAKCVKNPISTYHCNSCGHDVALDDMAPAELHCPVCHKTWHYKTNCVDAGVQCQCVQCGGELSGWWDKQKRAYISR